MNNKGTIWSAAEIEQLKTEVNRRLELDQIVAAHGRTPYAVVSKMHSMGWLILVDSAYHLVEPDPWALLPIVKQAQQAFTQKEQK